MVMLLMLLLCAKQRSTARQAQQRSKKQKKLNGSTPHKSHRAKTWMPLGTPAGLGTFSTKRKTTVKITIVESGFSNDHAQPSTERLYLLRSSRSVRLLNSSRDATYSATAVTVWFLARGSG